MTIKKAVPPIKKPRPKRSSSTKKAEKKPVRKKSAQEEKPAAAPHQPAPVKRTYLYAVGRRKSAVARVRLFTRGGGAYMVNGKHMESYFPVTTLQAVARTPIEVAGVSYGELSIKVAGGGVHSQAEAVRHGVARVLLLAHPDLRIPLKRAGLLTRDARVKERKKYGLKRARRAPQWQKR